MGEHCYACEGKAPKKNSSNTSRNFDSLRRINGKNKNNETPLSANTGLKSIDIHKNDTNLIQLQKTHGNQYTQKVAAKIQAKLKINQLGDIYEQEADRVADQVMMAEPMSAQRKCNGDKNCPRDIGENNRRLVQLKANESYNNEISAPNHILNNLGPGKPLDKNTRDFMEPYLGYDLSKIRIHTDSHAIKSAAAVNAKAFTIGNNIVFGNGEFKPGSAEGKKLIAHELVHTVQQTSSENDSQMIIQRTPGEVHDLSSTRFAGDPILEDCYDDQARLTKGAKGKSVSKVQQALIDLGYNLGPKGADGIYGDFTWNAVKQFKFDQNLGWEKRGDVGPGTMDRLDQLFSSPNPPTAIPPTDTPPWTTPAKLTPTTDTPPSWTTARITSETVEPMPAPRTRTTIGVGEEVDLTYLGISSPPIQWYTNPPGNVDPDSGSKTRLKAPDTGGKLTAVAYDTGSHLVTLDFDVISPIVVSMKEVGTNVAHNVRGVPNRPDIGIRAEMFLLPDNVNFYNVVTHELDSTPFSCSGVFDCLCDGTHCQAGQNNAPCAESPSTNLVVSGMGTKIRGIDCNYSGECDKTQPYMPGNLKHYIPWEYKVGNGPYHKFCTVVGQFLLLNDGNTLIVEKAGAHGQTTVTAGQSIIPRCPTPVK